MARATWNEVRTLGERTSFDFYKETLLVRSGARAISLQGVLDASQDRGERAKSPDGTFPVLATLACWREEIGFVPSVNEALRIARAAHPTEEQVYLVVSVDMTSELLIIELQANTSDGNPFFH